MENESQGRRIEGYTITSEVTGSTITLGTDVEGGWMLKLSRPLKEGELPEDPTSAMRIEDNQKVTLIGFTDDTMRHIVGLYAHNMVKKEAHE